MLPDPGPPRQQRWFGRRAMAPPCAARPVRARAPRPVRAGLPVRFAPGLRGPAGSGLSGLSA